jgi:hypothetical protein
MISPLLHTWNLNLGYAKRLVTAWRRVQGMGRV